MGVVGGVLLEPPLAKGTELIREREWLLVAAGARESSSCLGVESGACALQPSPPGHHPCKRPVSIGFLCPKTGHHPPFLLRHALALAGWIVAVPTAPM